MVTSRMTAIIDEGLHYDHSDDVGSEHCSDRMKQVISCFPDFVSYEIVITSYQGIAAVGIGYNKLGSERAAYLAMAITATNDTKPSPAFENLTDRAVHAEVLMPRWKVEIAKFTDPTKVLTNELTQGTNAVVWHVEGNIFKAFFSSEMLAAKEMYCNMVQGPCAAALFDDKKNVVKHYGRYNQSWWHTQLCSSSMTGRQHQGFKAKMRCDDCSKDNRPWSNFCSGCGSRLTPNTSAENKKARTETSSTAVVGMEANYVSVTSAKKEQAWTVTDPTVKCELEAHDVSLDSSWHLEPAEGKQDAAALSHD